MTNDEIIQRLKNIEAEVGALMMHLINDEPAPAAEPAPQVEPGAIISLEDVRAVLTKVSGKHGAGTVKQLLAPHKKLSDVPPTEWAALIAKAEMIND